MPNKVDLICLECPLNSCSQDSLWCVFRFVTKPNPAQQHLVQIHRAEDRKQYLADYYQSNREKKMDAALARYRAMKAA